MSEAQRSPAYAPSSRNDFTALEAREIARISATQGWQVAAHDYMRTLHQGAYRLAVDEYQAQLRFLLPLTSESRVLILRSGWGPVALNLASWVGQVVAMDDRPAQIQFLSARKEQGGTDTLSIVYSSSAASLPFGEGTFDAVIVLDALEHFGPASQGGWRNAQQTLLNDVRRVLQLGGHLLLGAANRLGFARPRAGGRQHLRTYWSYRSALRRAHFTNLQFHAPLPSHYEPFFILPLDRWQLLNHFIDGIFTAQDYRYKLEARGLGSAYRLAWAMWRVGRRLRLTGLARYVTPSYLILAQKQAT